MHFYHRSIICFFYLLTSTEAADIFLTKPFEKPYFVHESENDTDLTLPCVIEPGILNNKSYEISWARYNNGQLQVISKNDKLLVRKNSRFVLDYNPKSGRYNLKVVSIKRIFIEGTYHCNVIATDGSDFQISAIANVVVLVPPGDPMIISALPKSVIEGDVVAIKCISVGGSPQPSFTWSLPNGTMADVSSYTTQFKEGSTESLLHFRVTASDNGNSIVCSLKNEAMEENEIKSVKSPELNVFFKPVVSIMPAENFTHLSVEESSFVNLTCEALSNPPPHSFEWKHVQSGERYQGRKWPLIINASMTGDFQCISTNNLGEGRAELRVLVQYAPIIYLPTIINPDELDEIDIECQTDAFPEVTDVHWVGPNFFKTNSSHLVIKRVSKEDSGQYTCVATNFLTVYGQTGSQQRIKTATTTINVRRKPGIAHIVSTQKRFQVGETIVLECSSEDKGNPAASYKWSTPFFHEVLETKAKHTGKIIEIRNAQLSDNGLYSCRGFNTLGEGLASFVNITVVQKAVISSPLTTERIFATGDENKTLECEAEGYPAPVFHWLKNGVLFDKNITNIIQKSKCNPEEFCTQKVVSILFLPGPLTWSDKGNFTCIADSGASGVSKPENSWTIVRVLHKPVIFKKIFNGKSRAAAEIGFRAVLSCNVSARPEPVFQWLHEGKRIEDDHKHSFQTFTSEHTPDQYEQNLHIENVQEEDYGEYICRVTNGNGVDNNIIELKKTSMPGTPSLLRKIAATSSSILLHWVPQFDGGYQQTFVVEARKWNPFTSTVDGQVPIVLKVEDVEYHIVNEAGGISTTNAFSNITGLEPLSLYSIRLKSENEKGLSNFTNFLIASTDDVKEDKTMMPPSQLIYDFDSKKIRIEPTIPVDACVLLYVLSDKTWRATKCYASSSLFLEINIPNTYKARFCNAKNELRCSPLSEQISIGSLKVWKTSLLLPLTFFIIIGTSVSVFIFLCCKTRSAEKISKSGPVTPSSIPVPEESKKQIPCIKSVESFISFNSNKKKSCFSEFQKTCDMNNTTDLPFTQSQIDTKSELILEQSKEHSPRKAQHSDELEERTSDRVVREIIV